MRKTILAAGLLLAATTVGCGDYGSDFSGGGGGGGGGDFGGGGGGGGGDLGATPGGNQDIGYARDVIAQGGVPGADAITVEGLLSEHDLPTLGPPCESLLCARPALGVARSLETGRLEAFVHLGMTTGVDAATFVRPPIDLVVAIDKSASMSIDIAETTEAVARLIGKMRPDDRLAIVAFDDSLHELHPLAPVADPDGLAATVRAIGASGSMALDAAVTRSYQLLRDGAGGDTRLKRVIVLACSYPYVDPAGADGFSQLVAAGARDGIGMSYYGVLLGYSPELGNLLGRTPGGAHGYLESFDKVVAVFDVDFDVMITPVAYDLHFGFDAGAAFELERLYGIPADPTGAPRSEFDVATAFFSRRRGALVARLSASAGEPAAGADVGSVTLSYRPEPALGWTAAEEQTTAIRVPPGGLDSEEAYYQSLGVRKAVALVNQAERMRAACTAWTNGDRDGARAILVELRDYLAAEAEALDDDGLRNEVELVARLLANMA